MPEIPKLLPFTGVCASGRRPRVRWTVTIDASQIRFVSLAEEPEGESGSARKADCSARRIEAVGLCDAGGRFSRNFGPRHCDHRRVRRCLVALGGFFTTCHFIVVISAEQGCAKNGKAEADREDSPAIRRNTCGGLSTLLCRTATSVARGWTTMWHPFPPKPFWAEFWAEIWRFIR